MKIFSFPQNIKKTILTLGAESDGNFCFFERGKIYFSESFGDLLDEKNWQKYQKAVLKFLKKNKLKPDMILTDLHPLYLTTTWGKELSKIYKAKHIQVQHHLAHVFSAIGDSMVSSGTCPVSRPGEIYGVAMDGTGYGEDGKIWGGEAFTISNFQFPISNKFSNSNDKISKQKLHIKRIGRLENQTLIGGDLAVREPARMLINILDRVSPALLPPPYQGEGLGVRSKDDTKRKNYIHRFVKKYYTKNEFELIYAQLQQKFNCLETSSTGRILDAVSLLLGFCENNRKYKHEPIALLESNSRKPYTDLKPKIKLSQGKQILNTTFLFEYLVKNLHKNKKRLAATAQLYIAEGLYEIIKKNIPNTRYKLPDTFIAGGIANNKIISEYLVSQGAYANKKIPRGDAGLSFGQIAYYLLSK
jgi:hydrogenase maturation protein HypF